MCSLLEELGAHGEKTAVHRWCEKNGRNKFESVSFAELDMQSRRFELHLRGSGVVQGDILWLLWMPNGAVETIALQIGLLRMGVTAIFFVPTEGVMPYLRQVERVQPTVMWGSSVLQTVIRGFRLCRWFTSLRLFVGLLGVSEPVAEGLASKLVGSAASDIACFINTSGASGTSKIVPVKRSMLRYLDCGVFDPVSKAVTSACGANLEASVFLHNTVNMPLSSLVRGQAVAVHDFDLGRPDLIPPASLISMAERLGCQLCALHAHLSTLQSLLDYCENQHKQLPHVRVVATGGAEVHPTLHERVQRFFPNAELFVVYACTEVMPIALSKSDAVLQAKSHTILGLGVFLGKPNCDICEVRIENARVVEAGTGKRFAWGEISLRGPAVSPPLPNDMGTLSDSEWIKNGDVGWMNDEGELFYMGRHPDVVPMWGGGFVPAVALEAVVMFDTRIKACAFLSTSGLAGSRGRGVLVLELQRGANFSEVRDRAAVNISSCVWASMVEGIMDIVEYRPLEGRGAAPLPVDERHYAKILRAKLRSQLETGKLVLETDALVAGARWFHRLGETHNWLFIGCITASALLAWALLLVDRHINSTILMQ